MSIMSRLYKLADFSVGMVCEMLVALGKKGFSPEMATEIANAHSGKAEGVVGLFQTVPATQEPLAFQQAFYKDFLGMEVDFSDVPIPEKREDFDRLLVIAQGLTSNQVFEACQRRFKCWRYTDDLDAATRGRNEREPTQHYAIWVRDRQEADEELKNLSADDIEARGLKTETLLERLVHEAMFFARTGKHLDVDSATRCSGSRVSGGHVLHVHWHRIFDRMCVGECGPRDVHSDLRSRVVVSTF